MERTIFIAGRKHAEYLTMVNMLNNLSIRPLSTTIAFIQTSQWRVTRRNNNNNNNNTMNAQYFDWRIIRVI